MEDALCGAAHRAASGRLACVGRHPRGLRAGPRRSGRSGDRLGGDRVRAAPGRRLRPGDHRVYRRHHRHSRRAGHRLGRGKAGWDICWSSCR